MPTIDPEKITPHPSNTRLHPRSQIDDIKRSIVQFGFARPVVIDEDDTCLAGHGAVIAAVELKREGVLPNNAIPYHRLKGLSDQQKRAYVIADNRLGELSKWDKPKLLEELADLEAFDLGDIKLRDMFEKPAGQRANVTLGGARFLLQIEVGTEPALRNLFEELRERGFTCKILS